MIQTVAGHSLSAETFAITSSFEERMTFPLFRICIVGISISKQSSTVLHISLILCLKNFASGDYSLLRKNVCVDIDIDHVGIDMWTVCHF